jgi:hypothetical protein
MRTEKLRLRFEQILDTLGVKMEEAEDKQDGKDEYDSQCEIDLMKKTQEEDEQPSHFENEGDSMRKIGEEDEYNAHPHIEQKSVRIMEDECECPAHSQNEVDSMRNLTKRLEGRFVTFDQYVDIIRTIIREDEHYHENEDGAQPHNNLDSVCRIEEDKRPTHFQNEQGSPIIKMENLP